MTLAFLEALDAMGDGLFVLFLLGCVLWDLVSKRKDGPR